VVGGAAVTEEIVPGFMFSRASYVLSLLRPHIYSDLELNVCINHIFTSLSITVLFERF
jgi:phytoene dehydrogenase-like protein